MTEEKRLMEAAALVNGEFETIVDSVLKIDIADGDMILVTMPENVSEMPVSSQQKYMKKIADGFDRAFDGKDVQTIIVPHGMKVELIKGSLLQDK